MFDKSNNRKKNNKKKLTCACRFGSSLNKQPTCCPCVCMIPAQTILSGLGSMPSSNCIPNPSNLLRAAGKSNGCCALNTRWARCCSLKCSFVLVYVLSQNVNQPRNVWTYPPKFFHRVKKDSPFISVGSKNLFKVSGNLTLTFCWTPLYRNDMSSEGVSVNEKKIKLFSCRFLEK